MKFPKYLILSLVHCLIITTSSDSECQPSFSCGNLSLSYPFTHIHKPECGLFPVVGCNSKDEPLNVQLEAGRSRYDISHATNSFCFHKEKFLKGRSQISLRNVSPLYLLALNSGNLTLLVCKTNISQGKSPSHPGKSYNKTISASFIVCRENRTDDFPVSDGDSDPDCSRIQEPVLKLDTQAGLFLFEKLTTDCTLAWHISDDSSLTNAKKESTWLLLILGGGLLLILVFLLLALYIIRLRRKIINLNYLHRKISLVPSLSEIDGGSSFFGIPIFSYRDLEIATNNFDPSKILGDGGFGTVYYGKLRDGTEVAIKRLYEQNCRRVEQFINEIKILTSLWNPHLVTLYGCTSRRSRELLLVYEYIPNGTVSDHLHGDRAEEAPLTWPTRMRVAIETAEALSYLHKSDIIHRDVKTDNILLDRNFHVKVADFGLSRLFPYDATHISTVPGGTPGYIDPDYHQCYQVTDKSDVYSFGVVLVELISSMPAVDIRRQTHEINLANLAITRIQRCAFEELIDPSLGYNVDVEVTRMTTSVAEIAFRCLQPQKEMRPSMGEVLAFLKDI